MLGGGTEKLPKKNVYHSPMVEMKRKVKTHLVNLKSREEDRKRLGNKGQMGG